MGKPIATKKSGFVCFAFPDVCNTQAGPSPVAIPYPNIGDLGSADKVSDQVFAGGDPIILEDSEIRQTTGDEAGSIGGVNNGGQIKGKVTFTSYSESVKVNGKKVVRMFDSTEQNDGNTVGIVLGGVPNILVGD